VPSTDNESNPAVGFDSLPEIGSWTKSNLRTISAPKIRVFATELCIEGVAQMKRKDDVISALLAYQSEETAPASKTEARDSAFSFSATPLSVH